MRHQRVCSSPKNNSIK